MKLVFSEHKADYAHYIFPYAIWAFPEAEETPTDLFSQGFLPSTRSLDRFYMCRTLRVRLKDFVPSSENRRILRKGEGISLRLVPKEEFQYTAERREFYKRYADVRFGKETMSYDRLDSLFAGRVTSHLMIFNETESGRELGTITLYLEDKKLAYYYYSFYDLDYLNRNLGMFMMTSAAKFFAEQGFEFLYLGSCYSRSSLYKTQFSGVEFFNGAGWSSNLEELKYLLERETKEVTQHLFELEEYRQLFHEGELAKVVAKSPFRVPIACGSANP